MVDSFNCLRHDTVIGSNNENCNICYRCTSCTHCCKCFVARCIKECDMLFAYTNLVSTDVLCDTAGFRISYVCLSDVVEK